MRITETAAAAAICLAAGACEFEPPIAAENETAFCSSPSIELCLPFEGTVFDGSSRGNTVRSLDGTAKFGDGRSGQGLLLDGSFSLEIKDYRGGTTHETLELWLSVGEADSYQVALSSDVELEVAVSASRIEARSGAASVTSKTVAAGLHHVAIVVEGNDYWLYVDGALIGEADFSDRSREPTMNIGAGGSLAYAGPIDGLRVWGRALEDDEIEAIAVGEPDS